MAPPDASAAPRAAASAQDGTGVAPPLRVLHVFPTFQPGGVQFRIADVANRMGGGFDHLCIALDERHGAAARLHPDTSWTAVPGAGAAAGWRRWPAIRRRLRELAPDLLCTYNWGAIEWALANSLGGGIPHLHFESGFGPEEAARLLRRRNLARRVALRGVHRLVVPSNVLMRLARAHGWIAPDRLMLLVNGVDTAFYRAPEPAAAASDAPPAVLAVAPLRPEKRLDRLIDAFATAFPDGGARLRICGSGGCAAALEARAGASAGAPWIAFPGHLDDVRPELAGAAVFAMTSETEQMPNALLQAMAMARPVVAFDAGDIKAILPPEQRGLVFAQDDMAGFAAALRRLAEDPQERRRLGRINRERVCRDYAMTEMVRAYRDLYRQAAGVPA